jgi:non-heme chloroperoxidase
MMRAGRRLATKRSNFAHAAFAVLIISGTINTVATADEVRRVSANGTMLAYIELGQGEPDGAADVHGEDLAAFLRALGLSKVRIVAHSSGAHAALFFKYDQAVLTFLANH